MIGKTVKALPFPRLRHVGWQKTKPTTMLMKRAASANILTLEATLTLFRDIFHARCPLLKVGLDVDEDDNE